MTIIFLYCMYYIVTQQDFANLTGTTLWLAKGMTTPFSKSTPTISKNMQYPPSFPHPSSISSTLSISCILSISISPPDRYHSSATPSTSYTLHSIHIFDPIFIFYIPYDRHILHHCCTVYLNILLTLKLISFRYLSKVPKHTYILSV